MKLSSRAADVKPILCSSLTGSCWLCFRGGQTEGCQDEMLFSVGISSLVLRSHSWLPRLGDASPASLLAAALRRASESSLDCDAYLIQQLNGDSAGPGPGPDEWLPPRHLSCSPPTSRPQQSERSRFGVSIRCSEGIVARASTRLKRLRWPRAALLFRGRALCLKP